MIMGESPGSGWAIAHILNQGCLSLENRVRIEYVKDKLGRNAVTRIKVLG
jgi:hypothetical protein